MPTLWVPLLSCCCAYCFLCCHEDFVSSWLVSCHWPSWVTCTHMNSRNQRIEMTNSVNIYKKIIRQTFVKVNIWKKSYLYVLSFQIPQTALCEPKELSVCTVNSLLTKAAQPKKDFLTTNKYISLFNYKHAINVRIHVCGSFSSKLLYLWGQTRIVIHTKEVASTFNP